MARIVAGDEVHQVIDVPSRTADAVERAGFDRDGSSGVGCRLRSPGLAAARRSRRGSRGDGAALERVPNVVRD
jgi:hypothetical protein